MQHPHILAIGLLTLLAHVMTGNASESEPTLRWTAGVGAGLTELDFPDKLDADTTFTTYHLLASVRYEHISAALTYADTLSRERISEEDELGSAERRDIDITLAYQLTDRWGVFAGYKDGETSLDLKVRDSTLRQSESYAEDGLYAGIAYRHPIGRAGVLGLSAAFIRFDSDLRFSRGVELDEEDEDEDERLEFDDLEGGFSGDANGYSVALSWGIPIGRSTALRLQYKINQYDLKVRAGGQRFKPEQRLNFLDITLLHSF